ncbi:hypothetical protein Droror1_Dr00001182 [Drosera rotundifolia]
MQAALGLEENQIRAARMGMEHGREMKLRTAILLLLPAIDGRDVAVVWFVSWAMIVLENGLMSFAEHWKSVTVINLCGCGITVEVTQLAQLEVLHLDNNRLSLLPLELGELNSLKVLSLDNNMLATVPVELRQCVGLVEPTRVCMFGVAALGGDSEDSF